MKILHVIPSVHKQGGGTSEVVPRLCRAQQELGQDVVLATLNTEDVSDSALQAVQAGVKYNCESELRLWGPLKKLGYSRRFGQVLKELVDWADIVHIHGLWMWPIWAAGWEARRRHKPYVMMPHGYLEPERLKISKWKKKIVGAFCDGPLLRSADAVVATSAHEEMGIRQYGIKQPVHIMPIGLDLECYKISECSGKTLLYFSRITPIKGLDMLAEVWGRMDRKGWKLLIVGPDDRGYATEMKELFASRCETSSYEFRPPVFGEEKYRLLSSVDAFVLPTRSENWSIAVAEAMASGLPVVCTKGAPWECLNTVKAGRWVDISTEGIHRGLEEILSLSDEGRREMGMRGRHWVETNLGWSAIAKQMLATYERLVLK